MENIEVKILGKNIVLQNFQFNNLHVCVCVYDVFF